MEKGTVFFLSNNVCFKSITIEKDFDDEEYRDDFSIKLNKAFSIRTFKNLIKEFLENKSNKKIKEIISNCNFYDSITDKELTIVFSKKYFERFPEGWIFFKNMTGKEVKFITADISEFEIIINNGEVFRFYYGCLEDNQFWHYDLHNKLIQEVCMV